MRQNQQGQALIEFIIFLPFMLMLYSVVVILGDAINGSINQQKATRGFFFYRIQNSAHVTRPFRPGGVEVYRNWTTFGNFFTGWAESLVGEEPAYPCYKLNLPFAAAQPDVCLNPYLQKTTQLIRVGTVFGLCGASFARAINGSEVSEQPQGTTLDENIVDTVLAESSCHITE